jgi:hypothetical protein
VAQRLRGDWRLAIPASYPTPPRRSQTALTIGHTVGMGVRVIDRVPVRGVHLYGLSLASVILCLVLWARAKTIGEDERGNAERRALFVGLWPPMFWLIGDALRRHEKRRRGRWFRKGAG